MTEVREFMGTVVEKKNITKDLILFTLKVPKTFTFRAGQFIVLTITKENETRARAYSILSSPSQKGKLNFAVKIIPSGFASSVFEKMSLGHNFQVKGPFGDMILDQTTKEHWFVCVGTGISGFYGLINDNLVKDPTLKLKLFYGARTKDNLLFHEEMSAWAKQYPHFEYIPTLTRENWDGKMGRVQQYLVGDLQGKTFYLCGLKEFVLETRELLLSRGVPSEKIKSEKFD